LIAGAFQGFLARYLRCDVVVSLKVFLQAVVLCFGM
jgi:hypothetical protein